MRLYDTLEQVVDALLLTGTPEGAEKAWETRREGGPSEAPPTRVDEIARARTTAIAQQYETKRLKTITSYAGLTRWHKEGKEIGFIPRIAAYPERSMQTVFEWKGKRATVVETGHRRYEVREVLKGTVYPTAEEADAAENAAWAAHKKAKGWA